VDIDEKEVIKMLSSELLDVAQVAVSMMFVLEEKYKIDISESVDEHVKKLIAKGYINTEK
jgi:hypothetical protein